MLTLVLYAKGCRETGRPCSKSCLSPYSHTGISRFKGPRCDVGCVAGARGAPPLLPKKRAGRPPFTLQPSCEITFFLIGLVLRACQWKPPTVMSACSRR